MRFSRCFQLALLFAVLSIPLVSGCGSPAAPAGAALAVTSLAEDAQGDTSVRTESTFVIRDAGTLRRVWAQVFGGRTAREVPSINFNEQMVVIAAMGARPSTGYEIKITGAARSDRGVVVHVTTVSPGANCVTAAMMTHPVAVSRLRRTDGDVRFEFNRTTRNCAR